MTTQPLVGGDLTPDPLAPDAGTVAYIIHTKGQAWAAVVVYDPAAVRYRQVCGLVAPFESADDIEAFDPLLRSLLRTRPQGSFPAYVRDYTPDVQTMDAAQYDGPITTAPIHDGTAAAPPARAIQPALSATVDARSPRETLLLLRVAGAGIVLTILCVALVLRLFFRHREQMAVVQTATRPAAPMVVPPAPAMTPRPSQPTAPRKVPPTPRPTAVPAPHRSPRYVTVGEDDPPVRLNIVRRLRRKDGRLETPQRVAGRFADIWSTQYAKDADIRVRFAKWCTVAAGLLSAADRPITEYHLLFEDAAYRGFLRRAQAAARTADDPFVREQWAILETQFLALAKTPGERLNRAQLEELGSLHNSLGRSGAARWRRSSAATRTSRWRTSPTVTGGSTSRPRASRTSSTASSCTARSGPRSMGSSRRSARMRSGRSAT